MHIPADIPEVHKEIYVRNMRTLTKNTERIFLFAGDQKMEHLNADFYGSGIHPDAAEPEHLFKIAANADIGAFATHPGLIAQYGADYPNVPFIAKLNGKTDIADKAPASNTCDRSDPLSVQLWSVHDVMTLAQNSRLHILGVGYTIYLGSEYEHVMLQEAAHIIVQAHQRGLLAVLWIYPRGKAVQNDISLELLSGAAGLANSLGADIVKIKTPQNTEGLTAIEQAHIVKKAAGNTKVICAGGGKTEPNMFLNTIHYLIHKGGIDGVAVGRNIFQYSFADAVAMANAVAQIVYSDNSI